MYKAAKDAFSRGYKKISLMRVDTNASTRKRRFCKSIGMWLINPEEKHPYGKGGTGPAFVTSMDEFTELEKRLKPGDYVISAYPAHNNRIAIDLDDKEHKDSGLQQDISTALIDDNLRPLQRRIFLYMEERLEADWQQEQRNELWKVIRTGAEITKTANGGVHCEFYHDYVKHPTGTRRLKSGIEFLANNHCVLGNQKIDIEDKVYTYKILASPKELLPLPDFVIDEFINVSNTKSVENISTDYLIPEGTRDSTLFHLARNYYNMGLGAEEVGHILNGINEQRCTPSLESESIDKIVESAINYIDKKEESVSEVVSITDAWDREYPKTKWAVTGLLPASGTHIILGKDKSAKSFILLEAIKSVASCTDFAGKLEAPESKRVLLFSYEGDAQLTMERMKALAKGNGLSKEEFKHVQVWAATPDHPHVPNFYDKDDFVYIKKYISAMPIKPEIIVIDPLYKAAAGVDENSAKDMNRVMSNIREIGIMCGAAVWIAHHVGKSESAGARGSSVITGEADSTISVEKLDEGDGFVSLHLKSVSARRGTIPAFDMRLQTDGEELTTAKFIFMGYKNRENHKYTEDKITSLLLEVGGALRKSVLIQKAGLIKGGASERVFARLEERSKIIITKEETKEGKRTLVSLHPDFVKEQLEKSRRLERKMTCQKKE
jgi:hypothetical protein